MALAKSSDVLAKFERELLVLVDITQERFLATREADLEDVTYSSWIRCLVKGSRNAPDQRAVLTRDIGNLLVTLLFPGFRTGMKTQNHVQMYREIGLVVMALAGHKAANGTYPQTLDSLTPKYLRKIPPDLFVDKPLKYQRRGEGYVLYSVGPNMKDDGGKDSDDDDDEGTKGYDDIAVRCEP